MDHRLHALMLGCALMLSVPSGPMMAHQLRHTAAVMEAAAALLEWRDLRISLVCSESNPMARICLHAYGERPLHWR